MYLVYDTETTGFLIGKNLFNPDQPHIVQLGAALLDDAGKLVDKMDLIVKPNGYDIPAKAASVHGITTERALDEGVGLLEVLSVFNELVVKAKLSVCHNVEYDRNVILANYYKIELKDSVFEKNFRETESFCTMKSKEVIDYCALPPTWKMRKAGRNHYKTPNLTELHVRCFGVDFGNAHNAFEDVKATANVFFHLKKSDIINI